MGAEVNSKEKRDGGRRRTVSYEWTLAIWRHRGASRRQLFCFLSLSELARRCHAHFRLLVPCWRNHIAKQPAHISAWISYVVSVKEGIFTSQFGAV